MGLGILLSLFLAHSPAMAAECIPVSEVESLRKIAQLPAEFHETDLCNPNSNSYKLMETVLFMKNNRFSGAKVPAQLNQNILPENFWDFFVKDVKKISNQNAGPSCQGVIAFVLTGFGDGEINLCPAFYSNSTFMIERVSALLHEARHLDRALYRHSRCESGFSKGRMSCDPTFETKGSYAVSVESLSKMLASPVLSPQERAYGKVLLLQYLTRAFNSPIRLGVDRYTALHLIDSKGENLMFDGLAEFRIQSLFGLHFVNRYFSYLASSSPTGELTTVDLLSSPSTTYPPVSDSMIKYNNTDIEKRSEIIAVLNQEAYQAMVTKKEINVNPLPIITTSFDIAQVFIAEALGKPEINSFYVRDTSKNLYRVTWDKKTVSVMPANEEWNMPFEPLSVVFFNGQRLALKDSGEVMVFENGNWNPYLPLMNRKFRYMSSPILWNRGLFN